jgi:hypothetical protein
MRGVDFFHGRTEGCGRNKLLILIDRARPPAGCTSACPAAVLPDSFQRNRSSRRFKFAPFFSPLSHAAACGPATAPATGQFGVEAVGYPDYERCLANCCPLQRRRRMKEARFGAVT